MACAEAHMNKPSLNHLLGETEVNVMLVGATGVGKSSLINSLINLINSSDVSPKKELTSYIPTAKSLLMGGHTMMREPVELTRNLTVIDNRGWHDWENEASLKELIAKIHGERSLDDDVDWTADNTDSPFPSTNPLVSPKVNCVSIVLNGEVGTEGTEGIDKLIQTCRKNVRRRPSVVITHKDMVSDEKIEKIRTTLETVHGVDPNKIFVVTNITPLNKNLDADTRATLVEFIRCCCVDGEAGSFFHKRREETKSKLDLLAKQEEEKHRAKELSDLQHEIEVTKASEKLKQLQIATNTDRQRAQLESEIMENRRDHELKMRNADEKSKAKIMKITEEEAKMEMQRYEDYLNKAYKRQLDALPKK